MQILTAVNEKRKQTGMAELTIKALLFWSIYSPLYILGLFTADDLRYWILLSFLIITGTWRFIRWLRKDDQAYREKEISIREREAEIKERELKIKGKHPNHH